MAQNIPVFQYLTGVCSAGFLTIGPIYRGGRMLKYVAFFIFAFTCLGVEGLHATSWRNSCDADRSAIEQTGSGYVFRPAVNRCAGGFFKQRAEITSEKVSITRPARYVLSSRVSMTSKASEPFIFFQVQHEGFKCSPPLSLRWLGNGKLSFDSDYVTVPGNPQCPENGDMRSARHQGQVLKRDGTQYEVSIALVFDGDGAFDAVVSVNGRPVLSGKYDPPRDAKFVRSKSFYFKHGVYSRRMFEYEFRSNGLGLRRN
ncbi:hypothetical protein ACQZ5K_26540 [Agrobacterium sp. 22-226-1]